MTFDITKNTEQQINLFALLSEAMDHYYWESWY